MSVYYVCVSVCLKSPQRRALRQWPSGLRTVLMFFNFPPIMADICKEFVIFAD